MQTGRQEDRRTCMQHTLIDFPASSQAFEWQGPPGEMGNDEAAGKWADG